MKHNQTPELTWLRSYDKYKDNVSKKEQMEAAWRKALARIEKKRNSGSRESDLMWSAMSASMISLRLVKIAPRSMHRWTEGTEGEEGGEIKLGKDQDVGRQEMFEVLRKRFESKMWENDIA